MMTSRPRTHIPDDAGPNQLLELLLQQFHTDMANLEKRFDDLDKKLDQRARDAEETHRRIYERLNAIEKTQATEAAFIKVGEEIKQSYQAMDERMRDLEKFAASSGSRWKIIGGGLSLVATVVAGIIVAMFVRSTE